MNYCKYLVKHCCVNNFTLWNKLHQICHFYALILLASMKFKFKVKLCFIGQTYGMNLHPHACLNFEQIKTINLPVIHSFELWYNLITISILRQTFLFSHLCIRTIPSSPYFVKIYCRNFLNICKKREMIFWQHHSRYKLRLKPQLI